MEICEIFARCGIDVILISLADAALCIILKRTALKQKQKVATMLAYVLGAFVYAVYASVQSGNALYAFENLSFVTQKGVTIGTISMLLCDAADKFNGGPSGPEGAICNMLDGVIDTKDAEECAKAILQAAETEDGDELATKVAQIIESYGAEKDDLLCSLIAHTARGLVKSAEKSDTDTDSAEKTEQ